MRALAILGLVLVGLGGYILARGLTVTSREDVVRVGPLEATVKEERPVPPWVGGAAAIVGAALVIAGLRRRT